MKLTLALLIISSVAFSWFMRYVLLSIHQNISRRRRIVELRAEATEVFLASQRAYYDRDWDRFNALCDQHRKIREQISEV